MAIRFFFPALALFVACSSSVAPAAPVDAGVDAAPAPPPEPIPAGMKVFVGAVKGTDVRVGLVIEGDRSALFFCGGDATFATHTGWFRGPSTLNGAPWTIEADGWKAEAAGNDAGLAGTVDRGDGAKLAFSVAPVKDGSIAGLYSLVSSDGTAGVVVEEGELEPRAQGAFRTGQGKITQIIPLRPLIGADRALRVRVMFPGGARDISVARTRAVPR